MICWNRVTLGLLLFSVIVREIITFAISGHLAGMSRCHIHLGTLSLNWLKLLLPLDLDL